MWVACIYLLCVLFHTDSKSSAGKKTMSMRCGSMSMSESMSVSKLHEGVHSSSGESVVASSGREPEEEDASFRRMSSCVWGWCVGSRTGEG